MKKVAFIHTVHSIIPDLHELFHRHIRNAEVFHLLDESILKKAIAQGGLTPDLHDKVAQLARMAEDGGADAILVTCSSISPCVDTARKLVRVTILKIDEPMAEEACRQGKRIAVVATLRITLSPTSELIGEKARALDREVKLMPFLCEGAFEAMLAGDQDSHDRKVVEKLVEADRTADVIVLAQASMAGVIRRANLQLSRNVLTSPESGIRNLGKYLNKKDSYS